MAAETFVKYVIQACLVRIVATGQISSSRKIGRFIGANVNQVSTCRRNVSSLVADDAIVAPLKQKRQTILSD